MTERIDHAAEAERILIVIDGVHGADLSLDEMIASAQVHATLALAQEQRAANFIAYCTAADALSQGHKAWIEEEMGL
ncbi:hypothetical protein [Microbacterium gilvum]|uniref:Uncharacterized protein n=1 Tax=Microbacterium gilvum TaxID=1336204 RepID=A0ABP9A6L1_9MICO